MKGLNIILAGIALAIGFGAAGTATAGAGPEPYPLEYWALREVINNAQVSPDGKQLALMKIPSKDGNPLIEVYKADDLSAEPFRFNADPMEITNFYWASDNDIVFTLRQKVRDKIEGFNQGVYENRIAVIDLETEKMSKFDETNPTIVHLLPRKKDKIIISFSEGDEDGPASKVKEAFRPRAYWEFDLNRGTKKLLIRGKISLGNIEFDADGDPWLARGFRPRQRRLRLVLARQGRQGLDRVLPPERRRLRYLYDCGHRYAIAEPRARLCEQRPRQGRSVVL